MELSFDSKSAGDSSGVKPEGEERREDGERAEEKEPELEEQAVDEAEDAEKNHPVSEDLGFGSAIVFREVIHKVPEEARERLNFSGSKI